ncbi:hypothetical protein JVT61DRAFT_2840 [Boletus reticuloceps]|uniref:Uncharacterized protein n=1 Tax=Boletus reticuloceps TaxID=495285 RepID=A0A8I2YR91_9AGAM|nr:hypothetical protein JVT61DRAFT_2840 [Boletus reticuloceps]
MKDLPVPSDYRWSHGVIGKLTVWCRTQPNIWVIPNEPFAAALQDIFNVMDPGIKYCVTTNCSVHAMALQRISEWRSSFGSAALSLMISYFAELPNDNVPQDEAAKLHHSFRFLDESPDSAVEPKKANSRFVEVKGWNLKQLTLGKNGCGVIAIAAAALEHAIEFVCDGVIDVEQVLLEMDAPNGKMKVKLLKTLNKATGREMLMPYQFSASNWSVGTANYKVSVKRRGPEFICSIFAEAQCRQNIKLANTESNCSVAGKDTNNMDPHALLCMTSLSLLLT